MIQRLLLQGVLLLLLIPSTHAQLDNRWPTPIYNSDQANVIADDFVSNEGNPIRQGINGLVGNIGGIFYPQNITTFDAAKDTTIGVIHMLINYALGLLSLVALIYLIVHGIIAMTAMGDEAKLKKGLAGIKTAAIAIAGIGLSRLGVSLIFYIITIITSA